MHCHDHIVNHITKPELTQNNTLHVIGVVSNFARFHSRYRLFRRWVEAMEKTPHVKVYLVECALGDRQFECTEKGNPQHLQLRSSQEIWHKENMINLAEEWLLPRNWKYACWSDTDVFWVDDNWAQETLQQLQHYSIVQPWRDCVDLNHLGCISRHFKSFGYQHRRGVPKQTCPSEPYEYAHSGFAWACRRDFWEQIEKLIDWSLLGSADHHMAWGMINGMNSSVHGLVHENFKKLAYEWQRKAFRACQGRIGFTPTRIEHHFHGPKGRRMYRERWQILLDHGFDPIHDLSYDSQGLIRLLGKPQLLQACHDYLNHRHEDSIEEY